MCAYGQFLRISLVKLEHFINNSLLKLEWVIIMNIFKIKWYNATCILKIVEKEEFNTSQPASKSQGSDSGTFSAYFINECRHLFTLWTIYVFCQKVKLNDGSDHPLKSPLHIHVQHRKYIALCLNIVSNNQIFKL